MVQHTHASTAASEYHAPRGFVFICRDPEKCNAASHIVDMQKCSTCLHMAGRANLACLKPEVQIHHEKIHQ